ncbi:MAG: RluA family pseudouridine synthase [Clostridiales bacterium]|nr:RluA family pseudouridine synthase [Clostridiales bacterium]
MTYIAEPDNGAGERIDKFLSDNMADVTRSRIKKLILDGNLRVGDTVVTKANYKLKPGDKLTVTIPEADDAEIIAEDIPLEIVYEDSDMLVVNKPQGMVVHPAAGNYSGTLVNALLWRCGDSLSGINGEKRPGILHRIDKDTSGLLLVAKNDKAHQFLSEQIKEHSLTRAYKALVHGNIKSDKGRIDAPIGRHPSDRKKMTITYHNSREAVTNYNVLERFGKYTFVECILETGRTHQIRVHMSKNGHPIVGDKTYGVKKEEFNLKGQLLHAYKVGFIHPTSHEYMEFTSDLPEYYANVLEVLRNKS